MQAHHLFISDIQTLTYNKAHVASLISKFKHTPCISQRNRKLIIYTIIDMVK